MSLVLPRTSCYTCLYYQPVNILDLSTVYNSRGGARKATRSVRLDTSYKFC
jgi:hypothetical protein